MIATSKINILFIKKSVVCSVEFYDNRSNTMICYAEWHCILFAQILRQNVLELRFDVYFFHIL